MKIIISAGEAYFDRPKGLLVGVLGNKCDACHILWRFVYMLFLLIPIER